jgi:hypothetical protein
MALTQGVNCYVTLQEAKDYFTNRLDTDEWDNISDPDKEKSLMTATSLLDDNVWIGVAVSSNQSLAWPRTGAVYVDPRTGLLTQLSAGVYPDRIKWAVYELAYHLLVNENLTDNTAQTFERIKIGSIEIEDKITDFKPTPIVPLRIKKLIAPLLVNGGSRAVWRYN